MTTELDEVVVTLPQLVAAMDGLQEEAVQQQSQGWGEEGKCTHNDGYVTQPVYACATCFAATGELFGFCFGCSLSCHLEHEVLELFNKRNFRCDCPTPKSAHICTISGHVQENNTSNKYNHNFQGTYCWCDQPYDHNSNVIMIQCYMCQDWFHDTCILKEYPHPVIPYEGDNDFICKDCMFKYSGFLVKYPQLEYTQGVNKVDDPTERKEKVYEEHNTGNVVPDNNTAQPGQPLCLIQDAAQGRIGNIFLKLGWRKHLCRCPRCIKMYHLIGTDFLLKEENDYSEDEENDEDDMTLSQSSLSDSDGLNRLNPHVQREIANGMFEFKQELVEFLRPFMNQKRTVTASDIEQFKTDLQERQRKRRKF